MEGEKEKELDNKIQFSESKCKQYLQRLQSIVDLIPEISDENIKKLFLSKARTIEDLRYNFSHEVDEVNLLKLKRNPKCEIDLSPLDSFDDLYGEVMLLLDKIRTPQASGNDKSDHDHIKIPQIELPYFDGELQNFPFFFETFKKLIHDNPKMTDSDRVHYLLSHLLGKARSICAGVVPSGENYKNLWETLQLKYQDKRALGTSYLNQLFALKSVTNPTPANLDRVIDKFSGTIAALKQLKLDNLSEFIFVHVGLKLVDADTAKHFEMSLRNKPESVPTYEEFVKFVREQVRVLERTTAIRGKSDSNAARASHSHIGTDKLDSKCPSCGINTHTHLYECDSFLKMNPKERYSLIKDKGWCINCLGTQHTALRCRSNRTCRKCNNKHHSLLHFTGSPSPQAALAIEGPEGDNTNEEFDNTYEEQSASQLEEESDNEEVSLCTMSASTITQKCPTTEVLATARVLAVGRNGKDVLIRCLLDPGSQKHYITEKCCHVLGLPINTGLSTSVRGIGGATQPVKGSVKLKFRSKVKLENQYTVEALVLQNITAKLPTCPIEAAKLDALQNLTLADETWASPGDIDVLLGVQLFAEMLLPGKVITGPGLPDALETALGYIIVGDAPVKTHSGSPVSFCATYELGNLIKKFWEVEDLGATPLPSLDDKQAEDIYKSTVKRSKTGRYEVALPFKLSSDNLGTSFRNAEKRQINLERKFRSQPKLKTMYDEVIKDHLEKGYLSPIQVKPNEKACYIAHHPIVKEDKSTTKLRIVLDASAATDNGVSLNDVLHAGPSLQADLLCILLNLRLFPIALSADVRQMYLAIEVREADRAYQRILYRFNELKPLQAYQYNRVAFGLRCSPFLALRTVQQLAADEGERYPNAKDIILRDVYMDDIASSVINEEKAVEASRELIEIFRSGGFELAKWSSNSTRVLDKIPEELQLSHSVSFDDEATLKVLGLRWYPLEDVFAFQVTPDNRPCTKRNMLSSIARLFDVLGLVAPIIVYAKILIKELWIAKIDWDEEPPEQIKLKWLQFRAELPNITQLKFPRHIGVSTGCSLTILGFADASEKAYGGMVYAHVSTPDDKGITNLICAKSKIAPLKNVSLARLELCALLVLSQLMKKIIDNYSSRYKIQSILAFSDSTVALCWVHSDPHRWQTYVANRVAKIQDMLPRTVFYHVKGIDNPSDCLSRGLTPSQLVEHPLWLHGPPWMRLPKRSWPIQPFVPQDDETPEAKAFITTEIQEDNVIYEMSKQFSSWTKYVRSVAYVLKFIKKCSRGPINATDLKAAEKEIFIALQGVYFRADIARLSEERPCSNNVIQLKPFLDERLLRVGGRLNKSDEEYDYKHPILLPRRDHIVEILIDHYHRKNCHVGPEALMTLLRQRYWIISARRIIRQRIHRCNACFRTKPKPTFPMMADLPTARVNQVEKPFTHTGCDYAGPLQYTPQRRRGVRSQKAYICVFTCLTTRAVHIEVATDLSTACFLAAFKRFLSRRGPVKVMYSDNGTNFIGAKSYLRDLHEFLSREYKEYWEKELAENRITWKTICPNAPHHGGCWESVVRSVKTLLFRTIGQQILSYEELITVLAQIESILNSRPLYTLSADPSEPTALTPAHFLNAVPLKYFPETIKANSSDNLLKRHEFLDKLVRSFWDRWRKEYLHTLQGRRKWNTLSDPVTEGTVVVIIKDNVMPLHWPLGVVVKTFPGPDKITRVVQVRTQQGLYNRPTVKLCPLPTQ